MRKINTNVALPSKKSTSRFSPHTQTGSTKWTQWVLERIPPWGKKKEMISRSFGMGCGEGVERVVMGEIKVGDHFQNTLCKILNEVIKMLKEIMKLRGKVVWNVEGRK